MACGGSIGGENAIWSVYNYVFNNPIMLVDPDGRVPDLGTAVQPYIAVGKYLINKFVEGTARVTAFEQQTGKSMPATQSIAEGVFTQKVISDASKAVKPVADNV